MVLWKNGEGCEAASKNMRTLDKESPQVFSYEVLSKEGAGGFKTDAAVGSTNRSATTSACVGWDVCNIENRLAFRKEVAVDCVDGELRQNGFTTTRITIPIIKTVGTSLIKR
jgi:hypothetical protein